MSKTKVYVFSGSFNSIEQACQYSQPQWTPEPDETASDAEYEAWEESNPKLQLAQNIGPYLDEDFIETVILHYEYLESLNMSASAIAEIKTKSVGHTIFVLVFEEALGGFALTKQPQSSPQLNYCGLYECEL